MALRAPRQVKHLRNTSTSATGRRRLSGLLVGNSGGAPYSQTEEHIPATLNGDDDEDREPARPLGGGRSCSHLASVWRGGCACLTTPRDDLPQGMKAAWAFFLLARAISLRAPRERQRAVQKPAFHALMWEQYIEVSWCFRC